MLYNFGETTTLRISKFFETFKLGFAVLEISEKPLYYEILDKIVYHFEDVEIINVAETEKYISKIKESQRSTIILQGLFEAFNYNIVDCCREINGRRDVYSSFKKMIVFVLEPCIVDYLIENCMSFWSCVVFHERLYSKAFNPFSFKFMLLNCMENSMYNSDRTEFIRKEFCSEQNCKRNCSKFKCSDCFYYSSMLKNFNHNTWLKNCMELGDKFFNYKDYQTALELYNFILKKNKHMEVSQSNSYILARIARTEYELGNSDNALNVLQELSNQENHILFRGMLLNDTAVILSDKYEYAYNDSYYLFKESQKLFEGFNEEDIRIFLKKIYYNISIYYYKTANYKCCFDYANKLTNISFSSPSDFEYQLFYSFVCIKQSCREKLSLTDIHINHLMSIYEKALSNYVYAFRLFSKNHLRESIKYLNIAKQELNSGKCDSSKNEFLLANIYHLKATALFYLRERKHCIENLKLATKHFDNTHNSPISKNLSELIKKLTID